MLVDSGALERERQVCLLRGFFSSAFEVQYQGLLSAWAHREVSDLWVFDLKGLGIMVVFLMGMKWYLFFN